MTKNNKALVGLLLAGIAMLMLPLVISSFWLRIVTGAIMWVGLAQSWNMLAGYMGYVSFGHGAFFGIGAYVTAILMAKGLPFIGALVLAALVTALFAAIIGQPTLRLQGAYFAIATWAFAEGIRQLVLVLPFTGGANGMRMEAFLNENFFYYSMLLVSAAAVAVTYFLFQKAVFGLRVRAIREEETASQALGLNTTAIKVKVFALSALFPGILGGVYAYWITYIHPESVLTPLIADQMVVMALLGGLGTIAGPIVGAMVLFLGNRILWVMFGDTSFYLVLLGLAIAIVILFLPDGIVSLFTRKKKTGEGISKENVRNITG
ncbi:branched-chain amino acid transport system permease protein LivM [Desulfocucumis palustris]|uniref:Branched-chain amino acid transport system permease protein LivM n=1 Tax=Desulfocucumis palustris TaxID=1898651 RepID=A0A2L2XH17_9FIRM|nr:branched-chain amino acid ABC transporter permease [Desulfocucumis palustris]GBF35284.1 branched-chain amino acid transport system permease protein LivM [Desulfocucumis palustris]